MSRQGYQKFIPVFQLNGEIKQEIFYADSEQVLEYAMARGKWRRIKNPARRHEQLIFTPSSKYPLFSDTGKLLKSFKPYIGLTPKCRLINPEKATDLRLKSHKNFSKHPGKLEDYLTKKPKVPTLVETPEPLQLTLELIGVIEQPEQPVLSVLPVQEATSIIDATINTIRRVYGCTWLEALKRYEQNIINN